MVPPEEKNIGKARRVPRGFGPHEFRHIGETISDTHMSLCHVLPATNSSIQESRLDSDDSISTWTICLHGIYHL
jgi:hypothetical protein